MSDTPRAHQPWCEVFNPSGVCTCETWTLRRDLAAARERIAAKDAEIARLREAGYVLAMRLLQQDTLVLDDTEIAARDLFLARASQVVAHAALEAKP